MLFSRDTWGEWNQALLGMPCKSCRPETEEENLLVLNILLISISKSPKTAYLLSIIHLEILPFT